MKVNLEIEELVKAKQQNDAIHERLVYLDEKLQKLLIKEKAYQVRTEEELADVKRLEELGLRSLFKKVIGDLDAALEKERKEYLSAVLKHRAVEEEITILKYENDLLKHRWRSPAIIEKELATLIKKKESQLKAYDTKFSKELFKRESELGRYKLLRHKSEGVLKKAEVTTKILNEIKAELLQVKDWPPSGVGKYASVVKKRYIDRARAKAIQAKVRLEEFAEVTIKLFTETKLAFDLESFDDFLDDFYDNIITDYVIQKKLGATLLQLNNAIKEVSTTSEIVLGEHKKYDEVILERQQSLEVYIRDYELKSST